MVYTAAIVEINNSIFEVEHIWEGSIRENEGKTCLARLFIEFEAKDRKEAFHAACKRYVELREGGCIMRRKEGVYPVSVYFGRKTEGDAS